MRRTEPRLTYNPEEAANIAAHTARTLADMRRETDLRAHRTRYVAWLDWADRNHVCREIRKHVIGAHAEVERSIKQAQRPARNPAGGDQ